MILFNPVKQRYIKAFLYLVILVLLNAVAMQYFFHLDLTRSRRYSLSAASRKVVSTLSEPLTIKVFFTRNLPAPYNGVERYLKDLLKEYSLFGNRYFDYQFYDVDPENGQLGSKTSANRSLALEYGINPIQIQTIEKDEVKFKKAFMGLVIIHGDTIEKIDSITNTDGLEYLLTTSMEKLNNKVSALLALEDPVEVILYLSSELKKVAPLMGIGRLEQYASRIEKTIEDLNTKSYNKFTFTKLDPSSNTQAASQAEKYQLARVKWPEMENASVKAGQGTIGLIVRNGDLWRSIPLLKAVRLPIVGTRYQLTPPDQVGQLIDLNLNVLLGINADLGYLADHGTPQLGFSRLNNKPGLRRFSALAGQNYNIKPIRLEEGIPPGLKCLFLVSPKKKFSDWELFQIDQALMRGTNLAFFIDSMEEKLPDSGSPIGQEPELAEIDTGLEKLLRHWGINIEKSIVLDQQCFQQQLPKSMGGGQRPIYFAPIVHQEKINTETDFMRNIKQLVVFKAAAVQPLNQRLAEQKLTAYKLFSSSEKSWTIGKGSLLIPELLKAPPLNEMASQPLAYLVRGRFESYFRGKPLPEKEIDDKKSADKKSPSGQQAQLTSKGIFLEQSSPAQIFVMGSGKMLADPLLDPEGKSNNSIFIMNLIDTLNDQPERALMRGKQQTLNPLHHTRAEVKTIIKALAIAGLPLMVVGSGFVVWWHRRRRQKAIQKMFSGRLA